MSGHVFVGYYRVSTARQGHSGLGLQAQREAVQAFLTGNGGAMVDQFTEVESGAKNARPELRKAMEACRLKKATLVIARLDRLSRDAHFLLGLATDGVDFVAADMPFANRMTVGILASVAEAERATIAARTKAALAVAQARGVVLGGWKGGPKVDGRLGAEANRTEADAFAARLRPTLTALRARGLSLHACAVALAAQGVATARGGQWTASAVRAVLIRLEVEHCALGASRASG